MTPSCVRAQQQRLSQPGFALPVLEGRLTHLGEYIKMHLLFPTVINPYLLFSSIRGLLCCFSIVVRAFKVGFEDIFLVCEGGEKGKGEDRLITSKNNKVLIVYFVFDIFNAKLRKCRLHTINVFD